MLRREEQPYVVGRKSLPYVLNALFSKLGLLTPETEIDMQPFEFSYPHDLESFFGVYGMEKSGNQFNTARIKSRTAEIVAHHLGTNTPLQILTIVCPPYKKERLGARKNSGILTSIGQDPIAHGFLYSYTLLAHTLVETGTFFESLGINTELKFIIGDWALRDSFDRPDNFFDTHKETVASLDRFYDSAVTYLREQYPETDITVDRFKGSSIQVDLPFVVPQTPELKKEWLKRSLPKTRVHFTGINTHDVEPFAWALPQIVQLFERDPLSFYSLTQKEQWKGFVPPPPLRPFDLTDKTEVQAFYDQHGFLNWSLQYEANVDPLDYKKVWLDFFQIFADSMKSRSQEADGGMQETQLSTLEAGFWDACTKMYEYVIYGATFARKYPGSLMAYFDTKYPSAALAYQQAGVDLVFLDTHKFYVPARKLGIYLNPF